MNIIIVDTSTILETALRKKDLRDITGQLTPRCELAIVDQTYRELMSFALRATGKKKEAARLALLQLQKIQHWVLIGPAETMHVDELIIAYALANPEVRFVATQDADLLKALKDLAIRTATLRQKGFLNEV